MVVLCIIPAPLGVNPGLRGECQHRTPAECSGEDRTRSVLFRGAAASVTLRIPTQAEPSVPNLHSDGQETRGRELLMTALRQIIKSLSWNSLKATCFLPCILVGNLLLFLKAWGSALHFLLVWIAEQKWPSCSDFLSLVLIQKQFGFLIAVNLPPSRSSSQRQLRILRLRSCVFLCRKMYAAAQILCSHL